MAFNPGRNVGRLSIRVVPDTNQFRNDLKRRLEAIARTTSMSINVDKAKINGGKIREDIRRQMDGLNLEAIEAKVKAAVQVDDRALKDVAKIKPSIDAMTVRRLRRDIEKSLTGIEADLEPTVDDRRLRQQLDVLASAFDKVSGRLEHEILSPAEAERLRHRLNQIKDHIDQVARNREARLDVNPFTAWASARLAWLTRPRTVELVVKVSKASVAAALTSLAALSGARLSWQWIDDLATSLKNLDKNLPGIIGATTSITSLVASLFGATSGLVGIGQGLFSILPAFLVVPGLLMNAVGSVTALIVALKNAGTELAPLKDDMSELGDIINDAFWGRARQPILDLVNGLMPQLRSSFADLSSGIGEFTAALSRAFGQELANGRLASIFNGIAEGWRVLGTGAEGFAGALVSLSNVAATYTPRLAGWFVRQANTFDTWLKAVSEDGRLSGWMEDAIDSMYDLWDVTRGLGGVFTGLWRAAEAGGSGGLHGFGQLMLDWRRVVNGAEFQRGLTAVFRGASVAMEAFGGAVTAIGRLVADLDSSFEGFIGSAGTFLGGLIEGIADALNQPLVGAGLDDLSSGLVRALEGILPELPAIASTFGGFLGLLGDLAGTLLPTAAGVLADLMPSLDALIEAIRPVLPHLTDSIAQISEALAPSIADLVTAVGPILTDALVGLADALVDIAPVLSSMIEGISEFVAAVDVWAAGNQTFFDSVSEWMGGDPVVDRALKELDKVWDIKPKDDGKWWTVSAPIRLGTMWDKDDAEKSARDIADVISKEYASVMASEGPEAAQKLVDEMGKVSGLPQEVIDRVNASLDGIRITSLADQQGVTTAADEAIRMIKAEFEQNGAAAAEALWNSMNNSQMPVDVRQSILGQMDALGIDVYDRGASAGGSFADGLGTGVRDGSASVGGSVESLKGGLLAGLVGSELWATPAGGQIVTGLNSGITGATPTVTTKAGELKGAALAGLAGAAALLVPAGASATQGFSSGISSGKGGATSSANGVRDAAVGGFHGGAAYGVGLALSQGMANGISAGRSGVVNAARGAVAAAITAARQAGDINSPSRVTEQKIGIPLAQGVAVGIGKAADGIRRSMTAAVDLSDVSGETPAFGSVGAERGGVNLHIHNPVVRDLQQEAWEAAQMAGQFQ